MPSLMRTSSFVLDLIKCLAHAAPSTKHRLRVSFLHRPQIKLTIVQKRGLQPAKLYSGMGSTLPLSGFRVIPFSFH